MVAYMLGEALAPFVLVSVNWTAIGVIAQAVLVAALVIITAIYARRTAVIARETKNLATQTLKLADETTRMAGATARMAEFAERSYKRSMRPDLEISTSDPQGMTTSETDKYTRSYMVTNAGGTAAVLKSIEGVVGSTSVRNTIDHFLHPHANFPAILSWETELGDSLSSIKLHVADIAGNEHEWPLSRE